MWSSSQRARHSAWAPISFQLHHFAADDAVRDLFSRRRVSVDRRAPVVRANKYPLLLLLEAYGSFALTKSRVFRRYPCTCWRGPQFGTLSWFLSWSLLGPTFRKRIMLHNITLYFCSIIFLKSLLIHSVKLKFHYI